MVEGYAEADTIGLEDADAVWAAALPHVFQHLDGT